MLSGKPLGKVKEATYLGVALSDSKVADTKMLDRIPKAKIAVHQLKPLGLSPKGISAKKALRMYKCWIQPRWEYAAHLTPWTSAIKSGVEEVERLFFGQVFGGI